MQIVKTSLVLAVMLMTTACGQAPIQMAQVSQPHFVPAQAQGVVNVRIGNAFQTKDTAKTRDDIDHFHAKLVDQNGRVAVETDITGQAGQFVEVPDGEYTLTADARDSYDNSLVEGGEQSSTNTVTVEGGTSTYSDDSGALHVTLQLLNGTAGAGTLQNQIEVLDGQEAAPQWAPVKGGAS